MKGILKCLALVFFSLPIWSGLNAQIGVKAGFGVSDIAFKKYGQSPYIGYENNSLIHEKPIFSYQAGLFYPLPLSKKWTLQPELLFTSKGIDYSKQFLYDDITYKINISYLEVPVLLKYQLGKGEKWPTGIYLGPYVASKLSVTRKTHLEGIKESSKVSNVKAIDFGSVLGVMVNRKMSSGELSFDFRIGYSLINMMDTIDGHIPEYNKMPDPYARNISITLSIGYLFDNIFESKVAEQ